MGSRQHIALGVFLVLGLGACGNLENAPLRVGTIEGQLTEFDPEVAVVSLVGAHEVRSAVDAEGRFKLEGVPTGPAELFVVATAEKATRVSVKVAGGQSVKLQRVAPRDAGFFEMRVKSSHGERVAGVQVSVRDTPFERLVLDGAGRLRVGPLPDGCYALSIAGVGFPEVQAEACVGAGEKKELKVQLEANEELLNRCGLTGCADGLVCGPGGSCVECVLDGQCGAGMMCKGFRCAAAGPRCGACQDDGSCQVGAACQPLAEGGVACVKQCSESVNEEYIAANRCEAGFTCQQGSCLPDPARFVGCGALLQLGAECADDVRCQKLGLSGGLCLEGQCTVACTQDQECPGVSRCEDSAVGQVCSVRN
ncbi:MULTISPECIES: carboxypeptidase-like regulatory domain-containing protein [unclassified Myxococcus]|uniref:carboxypeptidase-like regulatory domain-containing protein n=1 Tax=unclassified Myxococcus TaxID=2648731 RepID=UPI00157B3C06|nr:MULTISPECIES: carboxypeptidase-like regulatory domain-containing protein [unclassified Myxococcus]NTX32947.1 carboxypeptidase regulatory-like domain-containing protein [Myxococcus sp. CA033]NTX49957.1 carboxypeptidase regulatory-like domain-containing protein [Myxococcus sp. CA039A]